MKRLFWKFFLGLFFAQIITISVVVGLFWFRDGPHLPSALTVSEQSEVTSTSIITQPLHRRSPRFPYRPVVVGLFTSFIFAYVLAKNLSKPIEHLRKGLDEVSHGNFSYKVTPLLQGRSDELASLGHDFDQTAEKLEQLMASQKRLLHDVSHELRSPLARMQIAIDILTRSPEKSDELIERLNRETQRLNELVNGILTLARLETADIWDMTKEIDLHEIIDDVVSDVNFEAKERDTRVEMTPSTVKALINGNQELLHRAIENVLRNAIAFNAASHAVHIRLNKGTFGWQIVVSDNGPGIPQSELTEIFSPFQRGTSRNPTDGYGLGLAIAQQTLKLHGGTITARNLTETESESGLAVTLELPFAT